MSLPPPPIARRVPVRHEHFGICWEDPYAWLRDPAYPEVRDPEILGYLEAENAYFRSRMAPLAERIEQLYREFRGRMKEDDCSVPVREGGFEYQWRFEPGAQYRQWYRRPVDGGSFRLILDENRLAEGRAYFSLRSLAVSPDGRFLAYAADEDGSERYRVRLRDLERRVDDGDPLLLENVSGDLAWSEDGRRLYYVELNRQLRPFRARYRELSSGSPEDPVVFEERDPGFFVSLGKTRSRRFILISTGTHVTTEVHLLESSGSPSPRLVAPRREGHEYHVDHAGEFLWITTNDRHRNFRLVRAPLTDPGEAAWQEVLPPSDRCYLVSVACFENFLAITERSEAVDSIRIRPFEGNEHSIAFPEPIRSVGLGDNREFRTPFLRLRYSSLTRPWSVLDYHLADRRLKTRKVQEIPSGYDPDLYVGERLWARSHDGVRVPLSIVRRRDVTPDRRPPVHLYGYGAYGHGLSPAFSPNRVSLLDRGYVCALAHVRGGDELGYAWYEDGKLERKPNTFKDFIACGETLVEAGYGRDRRIGIHGGSAGGMLMGVVLNERPELWGCGLLEVPFVDVLNTMMDPTLPLTPIEWPEWGDPVHDPEALRRILSYSPYDNIRAQAYPPILVTAGLSDPRVTYWEPAKYVARLRATRKDDHPLLLKTNMGAGHFGRSGRFEHLHELAELYAFLIDRLGTAAGMEGRRRE